MPAPGADLVTFLSTAVGALTSGTNLFEGPVRAIRAGVPVTAAFVLATGGRAPSPFLGTGQDHWFAGVQVTVRGDVGAGYGAGQTLARSILAACQQAIPTGYIQTLCEQSEPIHIGQDDNGHFLWSINLRMEWIG
jgi:hypothetical protein